MIGYAALSDPVGPSPLVQGALWVQHTMLGTIATTVAVIAIASLGFLVFSGRIDVRRGANVVIGCFILFGAPTIASGLQSLINYQGGPLASVPTNLESFANVQSTVSSPGYDPYAGALFRPN